MDHSFLASETPTTPMHVVGLQIFRAGPLRKAHGGIDVDRIHAAYRGVLHQMPRYRQKLMEIPIENRPVWIDDPHFRLDAHIGHVRLPRPGDERELKKVVSRLIAVHLDRRRPLWEAWLIEGLEDDRFAILAKTHHCMIDGSAGVEIAQHILSPAPDAGPAEAEAWAPRPAPSPGELFRDEAVRRATLPWRALRSLAGLEDPAGELGSGYRAMQDFVDASMSASSPTPINAPLGPHRSFDWRVLPLADVKAVGRKLGATVNDVALATATEALRGLLRDAGVQLDDLIFRASAPVSLRRPGAPGTGGNQVATWFVTLPIAEPDRLRQLDAIHTEMARLKASNQAQGMEIAMAATDLLPAPLLDFAAGFASTAVNTIVTNVPGPQMPLYLLGAPLEAMLPGVPLLQNIGLGMALMSYDGRVFWGLTADPDLIPDLAAFGDRVTASFAELASAAGVAPADPIAPPLSAAAPLA